MRKFLIMDDYDKEFSNIVDFATYRNCIYEKEIEDLYENKINELKESEFRNEIDRLADLKTTCDENLLIELDSAYGYRTVSLDSVIRQLETISYYFRDIKNEERTIQSTSKKK